MAFPRDGLASHVASPAGGWEPQRSGMGVIQLMIPAGVTSGDMSTIMLAIKSGPLPERKIGKATIPYLAGYSNVATKPDAPPDAEIEVHDYVDINVYQVMHDWSQLVFDQRTGFPGFAAAYKSTGMYLWFSPAAKGATPSVIRRWELTGVWPMTQIPARDLNYENNNPQTLKFAFAVDDYQYLGVQGG